MRFETRRTAKRCWRLAKIRQNVNASELLRLNDRIAKMEHAIRAIGNAVVGDVIDFDYLPEIGTPIAVNGTHTGSAIVGADFYNAVLVIFIGTHPVSDRLRNSLVGFR